MAEILYYLALAMGIAMSFANLLQTYKIYKTKSVEDLSLLTYVILVSGGLVWLLYGISIKNLPIITSYSIGTFSALLVFIGVFKYKDNQ